MKAWLKRRWAVRPGEKLPALRLVWLGLLAAGITFLVLYFSGVGLKGYYGARFDVQGGATALWWQWLYWLSIGGAITVGTLTACWRLIHRIEGQAHWGMALTLIGVLLFGFLIWPTPWSYRQFGCTVFQVNRVLGHYKEVTKIPACEAPPVVGSAPN